MTDSEISRNHGVTGGLAWLRRRLKPLAGLLLVVIIMGGVVYLRWQNPDVFQGLRAFGYLGAFVISIILNATILLPVNNMFIMMALGATLPLFWMVALAGGLGASIGELTGYVVGRSGRGLLEKSQSTFYHRVEEWVKRWGWIAVLVLSALPLIFDVVGIIAGALRMPLWRFFLACWLGRTLFYLLVTYLASVGLHAIPWFG